MARQRAAGGSAFIYPLRNPYIPLPSGRLWVKPGPNRPCPWSGPLGADIDQAAVLTMVRAW
jgi:hypothetical protein